MKKIIIVLILFILPFVFSGCKKKAEKVEQEVRKTGGVEVLENKSILDWLKGGKTVECTIMSPEGDIITTTKGESVYVEGIPYFSMDSTSEAPKAANGIMLVVGDWTYTWDKLTKKGTKMNIKEIEEMSVEIEAEQEEQEGWDEMAQGWDDSGFEYNCKEVRADSKMFEEPKDVEFSDMTSFMEGVT